MKILFLSPHPDDVEIGCGGTVSRMTREGHDCHLAVVAGVGDLTMAHSGEVVPFTTRMMEQNKAASLLGIPEVRYLNVAPAAQMDMQSIGVGVSILDRLFATERYDMLFAPLPNHNQDHRFVWKVVMAATRPGRCDRMDVLLYEQPMQFHGEQLSGQVPSRTYFKLSETDIMAKMVALACHRSQIRGREGTIAGSAILKTLARLRGAEIGEDYAEMFHVLRSVK